MFRDKTFNIAFLISAGWHLFCMLCVTIVVLPISLPMSKVSNVSFLGPLLEKTAFELMLEKGAQSRRALYREDIPLGNVSLSHEEKGLDRLRFEKAFLVRTEGGVRFSSATDLVGGFKFIPPFLQARRTASAYEAEAGSGFRGENFVIEGLLADRELLFVPERPAISKRLEAQRMSFAVELRFRVSSLGKVEEAVPLASSGYPDVDIAAINYIKGFQFSSSGSGAKPIWLRIKLNLKTK